MIKDNRNLGLTKELRNFNFILPFVQHLFYQVNDNRQYS